MSEEWEYIDIFEGMMNLFALPFFIIGFIYMLLIFKNQKTTSRAILTLLMFGGCLFSFGEILEVFIDFEHYEQFDQLADSYNIFIASILLILGFIIILEQKLNVTEEKYRHLFKNSPYSVVLLDLKDKIIDCNIATEALFETNKDDLLGRNFTIFFPNPSKLSNLLEERIEVMKKGKVVKALELQFQKKNKTLVWINLQSSLIELEDEIFIQVILRDITERKKAENIIKEEVKRLKEIDQIRSDFVRRTSHELKTPLISIYSSTQYLLEQLEDKVNKDTLKIISSIYSGGKRLKKLSENLLDVFDLETNVLILQKEKINLVELIKDCLNEFLLLLKERNIVYKLELFDTLIISADKIRIEQVIINLLSNAIKNTPQNGLIYIGLKKNKNIVDIIFRDSGVGFTDDEKNRVFEKFGKIERKDIDKDIVTEGSGLGLYISKQIVELHGGNIWVESEGRNKGSTFTIRLPMNDE
ncbi:MAG: ATP-binding protein [Candidatus Hermodarchaeota archaeon]